MPNQTDTEFERQFADLAHTVVSDKAPALADYLIGFQVLDVNEDQTKATGVFGCEVGNEMIYLPVFYLNGELKGSELMYLKNQDLFCPLQENWVSYLLSRKPYLFGKSTETTNQEIARSSPDLRTFYTTPGSFGKSASQTAPDFYRTGKLGKLAKTASPCWGVDHRQPWVEPLLKAASRSLKDQAFTKSAYRCDLVHFLQDNGPNVTRTLIATMLKSAAVSKAVLTMYPAKTLRDINYPDQLQTVKSAKETKDKFKAYRITKDTAENAMGDETPKVKSPDVEVITPESLETPGISAGISDEEKTKLIKGEVVIKDHRTNTSTAYPADMTRSLTSPTHTGLHKVLTRNKGLIDAVVVMHPKPVGGGDVDIVSALVLDIKGKAYLNVNTSDIPVKETGSESGTWFEFYSDQSELGSLSEGGKFVILTPDRRATLPFKVLKKKKTADGLTELWVKDYSSDRSYSGCGCSGISSGTGMPNKHNNDNRRYVSECSDNGWQDGRHMILTGRPGTLVNVGDTLMVPDSARVFKVAEDSQFPELGDPKDVRQFLLSRDLITPFKVHTNDGEEYSVTSGSMHSQNLSKIACVRHLVYQHGLNEAQTREIVKEADAKRAWKGFISYADPYPILNERLVKQADPNQEQGPVAPGFPEEDNTTDFGGYPAQTPSTHLQSIPSMDPGDTSAYHNPDPRLDQDIYGTLSSAAEMGQKEIFDTSAIGSLVKVIDSPELVQKYLGDVTVGLDRVGRMLFLFYQHANDFEETHGKEDMQELEESLKNVFKGTGDLVMYLRQRTVEKSPEVNKTEVDLTPVAS